MTDKDQAGQHREVMRQKDIFLDRLKRIVRYQGTPVAEFDCELCKAKTSMGAFTAFMYPDYSVKALCNKCGASERIRLDYSNKN